MKKYQVPDKPEIISKLIVNGFKIIEQSVEVEEDEVYKIEEILNPKSEIPAEKSEVKEKIPNEKKTEKKSLESSEPKKKYKIKKKNKK